MNYNSTNFGAFKQISTLFLEEPPENSVFFRNGFGGPLKSKSKSKLLISEKEIALKLICENEKPILKFEEKNKKVIALKEEEEKKTNFIKPKEMNKNFNNNNENSLNEPILTFNYDENNNNNLTFQTQSRNEYNGDYNMLNGKKRKLENKMKINKSIKQFKNDRNTQKVTQIQLLEDDIEDCNEILINSGNEDKNENIIINCNSLYISEQKDKSPEKKENPLMDMFLNEEKKFSDSQFSIFIAKITIFQEKFGIFFIKVDEIQFLETAFTEFNRNFKRANIIYNPHNPRKNPVYCLEKGGKYKFEFAGNPKIKKNEVLLFVDGVYYI